MKERVKISRNDPCPCGSGDKYKKCCIDEVFTWVRDSDGNVFREIEMTDELRELLQVQRQKLIDKQGRPPSPQDRVFDEPTELVEHRIVETMKAAGIPPAIIYAFEKTGILVSETNQHKIPNADLEKFNAAFDEWHQIHGEPEK